MGLTSSEVEMLEVARGLVGLLPWGAVEPLLTGSRPPPQLMGPSCRAELEDTLGRGVAFKLMRGGGWRAEPAERLWERQKLPPLRFTAATVELLQWLMRAQLPDVVGPQQRLLPLSVGDEVMWMLALDLVTDTPCEKAVAVQPQARSSPLCWLAFADVLGRHAPVLELPPFNLGKGSEQAFVIEAWQQKLSQRWARAEVEKGEVSEPKVLQQLSEAQEQVLEAFLAAANGAGRRELCTFILEAVAMVLAAKPTTAAWNGALLSTASLKDRMAATKAAGALLRAAMKLRRWDQEHRATHFVDDGYEMAQRLVKAWGVLPDAGFRDAERLLHGLEHF